MQVLGFTSEEQDTIFKILASVLHLGNVYFHRKQMRHGQEGVEVGSDAEIRWAAHLLQVNSDGIIRALTTKTTVSFYLSSNLLFRLLKGLMHLRLNISKLFSSFIKKVDFLLLKILSQLCVRSICCKLIAQIHVFIFIRKCVNAFFTEKCINAKVEYINARTYRKRGTKEFSRP